MEKQEEDEGYLWRCEEGFWLQMAQPQGSLSIYDPLINALSHTSFFIVKKSRTNYLFIYLLGVNEHNDTFISLIFLP